MAQFRRWMGLLLVAAILLPAAAPGAQKKARGTKASSQTAKKKYGTRKKKAADSNDEKAKSEPADFTSKSFLIHTDLSDEEARDLLKQLETMLSLISRYWGKANAKTIECYVVKDLANWPPGTFDPRALQSLSTGGGVTMSQVFSNGVVFDGNSIVYAVSQRGTPLHEVVHAYCAQTFGTTGPTWYSEGMAEMGHFWRDNDRSVNCDPYFIKYLKESEPKQMLEIVRTDDISGDSWQNYAWRWALCHLLANNTNYNDRFRPLGLGLLTQKRVSFEDVYGAMSDEISFEYLFFLKHLDKGYRVDLCSWDWKTKFVHPTGAAVLTSKVNAAGGWQASRLRVEKGEEYEYSVEGSWKLTADGEAVNADGSPDGPGKLVGTFFDNYELSESIDLGTFGTFKAPSDGNLVLRCRDAWNELSDNTGSLKVKLKVKGAGKPLPMPSEKPSTKPLAVKK